MQTTTSPSHYPTDDPRGPVATAASTARIVVAGITPEQLDRPTPCTEYSVGDLLGHTLGVFRRLAAAGRGEDPMAVDTEPPYEPVADWNAVYADAARELEAAWADPASLERVIEMPWATLPAPALLAVYTNELTVHTWDLAHATGQRPEWDEPTLQVAFAAMQVGLPADDRELAPFADVVPTPADAPLIDRLVAWNGRRPSS